MKGQAYRRPPLASIAAIVAAMVGPPLPPEKAALRAAAAANGGRNRGMTVARAKRAAEKRRNQIRHRMAAR